MAVATHALIRHGQVSAKLEILNIKQTPPNLRFMNTILF
jgi:hypothetical protein